MVYREYHFFTGGRHENPMPRRVVGGVPAHAKIRKNTKTAQSLAVELSNAHPKSKTGVMIAGNSGQPAGAIGKHMEVKAFNTQEEDMMVAWLIGQTGARDMGDANSKKGQMQEILQKYILGKWGMSEKNSPSVRTKQGVDYKNTGNPTKYGSAWIVDNAAMVGKDKIGNDGKFLFDQRSNKNLVLTFVSGPNCGSSLSPMGSTARTLNKTCSTFSPGKPGKNKNEPKLMTQKGYDFLRDGTRAAIRAGLLAMIQERAEYAVVAHVSGGIYAGAYKDNHKFGKWQDTASIVSEILLEKLKNDKAGRTIGDMFEEVYV
jgi:hypothetical protein